MKLCILLALSAVIALDMPRSRVGGQSQHLKDQMVGAWTLMSCDRTTASGAKQPYCVDPNGILILDASGRYAHMIAARGRPKLAQVNRTDAPAEEYKAVAQGFVGNFGTWSLDETDKILTRHYDGALLPNYEGREVKNSIRLAGDELTLIDVNPIAAFDQGRMVTVYRHVR